MVKQLTKIIECEWCRKNFKAKKFSNKITCSSKCRDKRLAAITLDKTHEFRICKNCKSVELTKQQQFFCSNKCRLQYCKKHKLGVWSFKIQSIGGKAAVLVNKATQSGFCYMYSKEERTVMSKEVAASNRKNKIGVFFNPELNRQVRLNALKDMSKYYFCRNYFQSKRECEFAYNLHYQFEPLIEKKNFQVIVGLSHIDFLVKKYKCFIEFHPSDRRHQNNETILQYYKRRRKVLDDNSYKDYNLLVIQ